MSVNGVNKGPEKYRKQITYTVTPLKAEIRRTEIL